MKVILINPPFYRFLALEQDYVPLSLLAVGSKMAQEGHDVYVYNMEMAIDVHYAGYAERANQHDAYLNALNDDNNEAWIELRLFLELFRPQMIGITVLNVKYRSALKIIEIARSLNIPVVVGGSHPTIAPDVYPSHVSIFQGEYESGGKRLKDLDETPFPNFDILLDNYSPNGYAHILSSRGCPYSCNFCSSQNMWHRRVTYKSVDRIISEMTYIQNRFKSDYFTFWDETFTANRKRLAEFCYKYELSAKWRCDTRADAIDDDMVRMMHNSGCGQMSLGIESGDNETLKYINKGETTDDFLRAAEILNRHNIQWKAYMIIGFPVDTEESILKSIEFVKGLKPFRITLSFFTPYQGTPLFEEVKALGLINEHYDTALFAHQSPHNFFCPKIGKERYASLRSEVSKEIDLYNESALKSWK